jgi:hypothetical protein
MEAIHLFYAANTFSFDNLTAFSCFQRLTASSYFHAIQSLHLIWGGQETPNLLGFLGHDSTPPHDAATWHKTCQNMAEMQALKRLRIDMVISEEGPGQERLGQHWERVLFPSLEWITGLEEFEVCVTWSGEDYPLGYQSMREWPFIVRRGVVSLWKDFGCLDMV